MRYKDSDGQKKVVTSEFILLEIGAFQEFTQHAIITAKCLGISLLCQSEINCCFLKKGNLPNIILKDRFDMKANVNSPIIWHSIGWSFTEPADVTAWRPNSLALILMTWVVLLAGHRDPMHYVRLSLDGNHVCIPLQDNFWDTKWYPVTPTVFFSQTIRLVCCRWGRKSMPHTIMRRTQDDRAILAGSFHNTKYGLVD